MSEVRDNQVDRGGEMSTPDARLNAAERAALADLEAAAMAADPALAARLRGGPGWRALPAVRTLHLRMARTWAALLRARWWGAVLLLAGLLLMAIGLGTTPIVSAVGAVAAAVGIRVLAEMAAARVARLPRAGRRGSDDISAA
ncbi:MAG TPA: DUF3040 domain-containing protein [Acidimicrobiales bacterium]|nr:DUF3040 domain-containing protein [Acidimicrobiales bacterium]